MEVNPKVKQNAVVRHGCNICQNVLIGLKEFSLLYSCRFDSTDLWRLNASLRILGQILKENK